MAQSKNSPASLERRRLRAADLLLAGISQAEVARRLAVSRATVHDWNKRLRSNGRHGLRNRTRGRPAALDERQRARLLRRISFPRRGGDGKAARWTLVAVAELIEMEFGRRYSRSQVSRILHSLDWQGLRPATAADNVNSAWVHLSVLGAAAAGLRRSS